MTELYKEIYELELLVKNSIYSVLSAKKAFFIAKTELINTKRFVYLTFDIFNIFIFEQKEEILIELMKLLNNELIPKIINDLNSTIIAIEYAKKISLSVLKFSLKVSKTTIDKNIKIEKNENIELEILSNNAENIALSVVSEAMTILNMVNELIDLLDDLKYFIKILLETFYKLKNNSNLI